MPIDWLGLSNVGPFRSRPGAERAFQIALEFDANVNLLIGPNNVGKSTILQALVSATAADRSVIKALPRAYANALRERSVTDSSLPFAVLSWHNSIGDYRDFWIFETSADGDWSSASLRIRGEDGLQFTGEFDWEELQRDFGYVGYYNPTAAAWRSGRSSKKDEENEDDPKVRWAIGWKRSYVEFEQEVFDEIERVILEITEGFHIEMGVGVFDSGHETEHQTWRDGQNKFVTMDGELTFPELSHGTRSVLGWVSQLMVDMADHYYEDDYWKERRGIFIIDEIDAHLHPSWQRRIIPTLQRHFPNVQIFASTHSPMMVAGLKKGQVHLLKRDETEQVVWSRNEQDIIGWTADEIYRKYMEIDDPTDERTARHAEELRELRNKDNLTAEDEARMQELRRLVNEDLLARGALNAQDERFDEMMRRFMANRMSNLSQDGA